MMNYFDECKDCTRRYVGCHVGCDTYKTAIDKLNADKQSQKRIHTADRYEDENGWKRR